MVGGGKHKVVLDESGFRGCAADSDWGWNFLSVVAVIAQQVNEKEVMKA